MHLGTHAWERGPFELTVIRNGQPTLERMKTLATSPTLNTGARFIDECAQVNPDGPVVLLRQATLAVFSREYARAEGILRRVVGISPHPRIVEFRLGEVLLRRNASDMELIE